MTPRNDIPRVSPQLKVAVWTLIALAGVACLFGLGVLMAKVLP